MIQIFSTFLCCLLAIATATQCSESQLPIKLDSFFEAYNSLEYGKISSESKIREFCLAAAKCTDSEQLFKENNELLDSDYDDIRKADADLIIAVLHGDLNQVHQALENQADIHFEKELPLMISSFDGHADIVKYLINSGAKVQCINGKALKLAIIQGNLDMVHLLVTFGALVHPFSEPPISIAAEYGQLDIIKFLITKGANFKEDFFLPFRQAVRYNQIEAAKYLLALGSDIHSLHGPAGSWPFRYCSAEMSRFLLSNKAEIPTYDYSKSSHQNRQLLTIARLEGFSDFIKDPNNLEIIQKLVHHDQEKIKKLLYWIILFSNEQMLEKILLFDIHQNTLIAATIFASQYQNTSIPLLLQKLKNSGIKSTTRQLVLAYIAMNTQNSTTQSKFLVDEIIAKNHVK